MDPPPIYPALSPRRRGDIAAAAHAVQANVAALRVAWSRHAGRPADAHDIKTPPPGFVRDHREILIDHAVIKDYEPAEIGLRLRQVWGEFTALCWVFHHADPHRPPRFDRLDDGQPMRCPLHVDAKLREIQSGLWRLRHELAFRHDKAARSDPAFLREHEIALARPITVYGRDVRYAADEEVLSCACEYAGMLAALRWVIDDRWGWEAPGIMNVTPEDLPPDPRKESGGS